MLRVFIKGRRAGLLGSAVTSSTTFLFIGLGTGLSLFDFSGEYIVFTQSKNLRKGSLELFRCFFLNIYSTKYVSYNVLTVPCFGREVLTARQVLAIVLVWAPVSLFTNSLL